MGWVGGWVGWVGGWVGWEQLGDFNGPVLSCSPFPGRH